VIEITSVEAVNGGAAARIPVRLVVQKSQERWFIIEYIEERWEAEQALAADGLHFLALVRL
jgi:hypothetical protein